MSAARAYEQAVRHVFGEVYPDKCMATYWGRDDGAIHVSLCGALCPQNRLRE